MSLDTTSDFDAIEIVDEIGELIKYYKIGNILFTKYNKNIVEILQLRGKKVLLDLKLFDVSFNIEETCKIITKIKGVFGITVCHHNEVIQAAKKGLAGTDIKIFSIPALRFNQSSDILISNENDIDCDGIIVDHSVVDDYLDYNKILVNAGLSDMKHLNKKCDFTIIGKLISQSKDKINIIQEIKNKLI
jgi:orotidine-5'-phosphate decarboxylase